MSVHQTTIIWERKGQAFNTKTYCRDHLIRLQDGSDDCCLGCGR